MTIIKNEKDEYFCKYCKKKLETKINKYDRIVELVENLYAQPCCHMQMIWNNFTGEYNTWEEIEKAISSFNIKNGFNKKTS